MQGENVTAYAKWDRNDTDSNENTRAPYFHIDTEGRRESGTDPEATAIVGGIASGSEAARLQIQWP